MPPVNELLAYRALKERAGITPPLSGGAVLNNETDPTDRILQMRSENVNEGLKSRVENSHVKDHPLQDNGIVQKATLSSKSC